MCLVGHHDALLEGSIVILAGIASVHRDLHRIELVLRVLTRLELVIRDAHVVVEKCHVPSSITPIKLIINFFRN